MKKIMSICLCLGLFGMSGCGSSESEGISYDEAEILKKGEAVIQELNAGNYQDVVDQGDKTLKEVLTVDQLKTGIDTYVAPLGAFKEHETHEITVQDDAIVIGFISVYEKGKIQYVISFDEAGAMSGIHLAPAS